MKRGIQKHFYIRVRTAGQQDEVIRWGGADALLIDHDAWMNDGSVLEEACRNDRMQVYVCLPEVTRQAKLSSVERMVSMASGKAGLVLKNPDQIELVLETGFEGPVLADPFLYAYNSESIKLYRRLIPGLRFIAGDELTDKELGLIRENFIYRAYGRQLLMVTAQCLVRNYYGCGEKCIQFENDRGDVFFCVSRCSQCFSCIFDGRITYMLDLLDEIPYDDIMLDFTTEDPAAAAKVLRSLDTPDLIRKPGAGFTRGHHDKGVE